MPATVVLKPAAKLPRNGAWKEAFRQVEGGFRDVRVRHGIKGGLAALLALWVTQLLRLEHPNWSVLAVLVLANTYYVGAVASRALMRSLGTVGGALLGVWAVGDFGDDPARFVVIVFGVVAVATYYYGQLASSAWPYAYYLVGLTLTAVATYGVADPANVWRSALQRVLETLVAVFCATFVSAVLWPRHASEEFAVAAAKALRTVRAVLPARMKAVAAGEGEEAVGSGLDVKSDGQILSLRTLLLTGGRGSLGFRARLGDFQRFLVALTHLRHAAGELETSCVCGAETARMFSVELDAVVAALDHDLSVLAEAAATGSPATGDRLDAAYGELEASVHRMVAETGSRETSLARHAAVIGHLTAWRQIRDALQTLRNSVGGLSRRHPVPVMPEPRAGLVSTVDGEWVLISLKAGISVCLAFLLLRWVHPPGANAVPVAALLCSVAGGTRW